MKYVLITGAYGGMGLKTTQKLASEGFTIFALDKQVGPAEENVVPIQTDVTDVESIKKAFNKIKTFTNELFAIIHFA